MTLPKFQPGDLAEHKVRDGILDPRPVHAVSANGRWLKLLIGSHVTDPVPASNYRRIPKAVEK